MPTQKSKARKASHKASGHHAKKKVSHALRCPRPVGPSARTAGTRRNPCAPWELVEKRYAPLKTELTVKVPYGGDDEATKAYRVGLRAYTEKCRNPEDRRVAITRVYFYPDFHLQALPDNYYVVFKLESLRSDGRWKALRLTRGTPLVQGGRDINNALAFRDERTTHSNAVITKVRIKHRLISSSYQGTVPLAQINASLTLNLRHAPDDFERPHTGS